MRVRCRGVLRCAGRPSHGIGTSCRYRSAGPLPTPGGIVSNVLPCPFCGKPPYVAEEIDPDEWWYVACQTPGCILPAAAGHTSIESAIAKWNRRAPASEGEQK
ncbi:hypothetical protein C6P97_22325 [Burkholderia multivorans]|uniref:Restriction alleviation protein, Lar family n=1 Tax=Burkholderia multivorans TaxID=87883 RepID=A0AB37B229_9BURK|nr:hypothetical protein C6P97_22325 [Burkholderia multivorans]PRE55639.1 hypothetical protein C6P99_01970 [Burkholderia multivorans]